MQVRLFSTIIQPGKTDSFELEINNWLNENPDIDILSMTVSTSERGGDIPMAFFVVYDDSEDDDGDELTVTIPQITVREIPPLTPRLK